MFSRATKNLHIYKFFPIRQCNFQNFFGNEKKIFFFLKKRRLRVQPGNLKMWFCATIWADLITPENCPYYFESVWFDYFWSDFLGGTYLFDFQKSSTERHKLGHFEDFWPEKVALSWYQNWHNLGTKIGSTFVKGSIESSEIRAFDRDLNEGAIIFPLRMRVEILARLWNPRNTSILAEAKMPP